MIKKLLTPALLALIVLSGSCNDDITQPEPEPEPGKRDYSWTVDTINYYDPMYRLWGSSPGDVWATNLGGNSYESIFHFDGNSWSTDKEYRELSPHSIYGFANNNVYIGGQKGMIWHYDGMQWKEIARLSKDGQNDVVFDNMWGESSDNFYAFGAYHDENLLANNSVIAHYYNNKWTMINTDGIEGIVEQLYKSKNDQLIYLQVIKFSNTYDTTYIYQYNNSGIYAKLYTTRCDNYWANISLINGEVYFILRDKIAKRIDNQFQTVLTMGGTNFYKRIWGRTSKDIFLLMTDGLAHYNGTDIEYLFYFNITPQTQIYGASLFEKDVFFLVNEARTGLSLIYHGK